MRCPRHKPKRHHLLLLCLSLYLSPVSATTCPYDLDDASRMMPRSCYANATSPSTGCCWYVFAAYTYAAARYANLTGAVFLPSPAASACSSALSALLRRRALVPPSLLSADSCTLTGATSVPSAGSGPCQYPTVAAVRSAVDLSPSTRLCVTPNLSAAQDSCTACQNAVIAAVFALFDVTHSKEFVPCGMAATIAVWSASSPDLARYRSYVLCMVQILENVGGLSTANLIPSPPPPPTASVAAAAGAHSRNIAVTVASCAAAGIASVAVVVCFVIVKRRRRSTSSSSTPVSPSHDAHHPLPTEGLYIFTKAELKQATNGYDERLLLGKGGAGTVYLGTLPSGQRVAIKRIHTERKRREFYMEVSVLAKLRHANLVTMVGYCLSEHALVYEYMAGGNLARALHGGGMAWPRRLRVAAEVAAGLAYLHGLPGGAVVHRDVKPTNVLLSLPEGAAAKLSDFGVSRHVPAEATHVSTEVRGTFGYVDPDSFCVGRLSEAADVYSFGVVLLEMVTGMRAVVPTLTGGAESIVQAARAAGAGAAAEVGAVVDPALGPGWDRASVRAVFEAACRCVRPFREERPTMGELLKLLKLVMADLDAAAAEETASPASGDELSAACTSASTPSVNALSF